MRAITDTRSFAQRVYQELGDAREKYGNTASEVALVEMAVAWALREEHEVPETRATPDGLAERRLQQVTAERDAAVAKAAEGAALLAEAIGRAERAEEERDAAREVLIEVEWSDWSQMQGAICPVCNYASRRGHRSDCALAAALGR